MEQHLAELDAALAEIQRMTREAVEMAKMCGPIYKARCAKGE